MAPTTKNCGHLDSAGNSDCTNARWTSGATYCQGHRRLPANARTRMTSQRHPDFPNYGLTPNDLQTAAEGAATLFPTLNEKATDEELSHSHEYVPMPDLVNLWHAVVTGAQSRPSANLMFLGPSGSGKTDGARYLAALVGLPFAKVDAASMTDPEAWFGTREIVVHDGVAVTDYRPSAFVEALGRPGVLLIDEVNRVRDEHRNVLLPLLDSTRSVTNPLTGETVFRDPKCFIIMSGNIGLHFTGTSAIDPAFMTRALTVEFTYIDAESETRVVRDATGCDDDSAAILVRFANETRAKVESDPEFLPISTREIIEAGRLIKDGLSRDLAVKFVVLNAASSEGGSSSIRQELKNIWNGVRVTRALKATAIETPATSTAFASTWTCPTHIGRTKLIPAGVSAYGKHYSEFWACPIFGCSMTSDKNPTPTLGTITQKTCTFCTYLNPIGRYTICLKCGSAL